MQFGSSIITKAIHRDYNAIMLCCNLDHINVSTAKTKFMFAIGYRLDPSALTAVRIDIYDRKRYNMGHIKAMVDVGGTYSRMLFVIGNVVEILTLSLFGNAFSIMFAGIKVNLHKLSNFQYYYVNNNDINVIMNTFPTIGGAAIVIGVFLNVIDFVIQLIDKLLLNIVSIELHAIIVEIILLALYSGVQSSIDVVGCNIQNVCAVFCYLLYFVIF